LKEGERVCGERGQFGKQLLWDFNTISKLRIQLSQCDMFDLTNWKHSRKIECPVFTNWNATGKAGKSGRIKSRTHL